jgi:hypothetical protein
LTDATVISLPAGAEMVVGNEPGLIVAVLVPSGTIV